MHRHLVSRDLTNHPESSEGSRHAMNIEHLATRVRAEFQEMPGLRLTVRQAERLWGLAPEVCAQVVDVLVSRAVLKRHGDTFSLAN